MRAIGAGLLLACALFAQKGNRINAGLIYDTVPHVVDGANWRTTIILVNMDTAPRRYRLKLHGDDGAARQFEFIGRGRNAEFADEIPRGGTVILQTPGAGSSLNSGWAELDFISGDDLKVGMMAIFGTTGIPGRPDFEATVPAWHTIQYDGVLPFDNTSGYTTSIALLNPSQFGDSTVPITIYDEAGNVLKTDSVSLRAGHKTAFALPERWGETAGRRGSIHFQGNLASLSVLGFRFHPGGAFTTVNLLEP
jgi:hypothetical protein